jgi:hypothetical protein
MYIIYMSVTTVGQNDDLHRLLESLNDLPSIKQPLGLIRDSEGPWHEIPPASTRIIKVKVKLFFVSDANGILYKLGKWSVSFMFSKSLCDLLKINEKNFQQFTCVSGEGSGIMPFDWDCTNRPYSEIKSKIDKWGRTWFEIPYGDKVNIELHTDVLDLSSLHLEKQSTLCLVADD